MKPRVLAALLFGGVLCVVLILLLFVLRADERHVSAANAPPAARAAHDDPPPSAEQAETTTTARARRTSLNRESRPTRVVDTAGLDLPAGHEVLVVRDAFTTKPVPNVTFVVSSKTTGTPPRTRVTDAAGRLIVDLDDLSAVAPEDPTTWKMTKQTVGALRTSGTLWVHAQMKVIVNVTSPFPRLRPHGVGGLDLSWNPPGGHDTPTARAVSQAGEPRFVRLSGAVRGEGAEGQYTFLLPRTAGLKITPTASRWMPRGVDLPVAPQPGGEVRVTLALKEPVVLTGSLIDRESGEELPSSDVQALAVRRDGTILRIRNHANRARGAVFRFAVDPQDTPEVVLCAEGYKRHVPLRSTFDVSRGSVTGIRLQMLRIADPPEVIWTDGSAPLAHRRFWVRDETVTPSAKFELQTDEDGVSTARHLQVGRTYRVWTPPGTEQAFEARFTFNGENQVTLGK